MEFREDNSQLYIALAKNRSGIGEINHQCEFEYEFGVSRNKKHYTAKKDTDLELLTSLAYQGLIQLYGPDHTEAKERVDKELAVIHQLEFSGYFLIT